MRGLIHSDLGQTEQAVEAYERVLALQPWHYESHHQLALAYRKLEQPDNAEEHLQLAKTYREKYIELLESSHELRQHPQDSELRERVAELYRLFDRDQEAAALLGE